MDFDCMFIAPNYADEKYGLTEKSLETVEHLKKMPLWMRRKSLRKNEYGTGARFIYKYLDFNVKDPFSVTKAKNLIAESKFYLSAPSDFNDPYDFCAYVEFDSDPVRRRNDLKKMTARVLARGVDPYPGIRGKGRKTDAILSRLTRKHLDDPKAINEDFNSVRDNNGVACFSKDPRSLLLWAYYAAGHAGICLQFDVVRDPGALMIANDVNYHESLPRLIWPKDSGMLHEKVIASKGIMWKHEREVRYVSRSVVRGFLDYDGRALTGVILGARFSENQLDCLKRLLSTRHHEGLPPPVIYKASHYDNKYGLRVIRHFDETVL